MVKRKFGKTSRSLKIYVNDYKLPHVLLNIVFQIDIFYGFKLPEYLGP